tara:strand:+ start:2194 stop:3033 length:840 start_codon:yes stop_codon:yes gene_type:complete
MINAHPKIGIARTELWLLGFPKGLAESVDRAVASWLRLPTIQSWYMTSTDTARISKNIMRATLVAALEENVANAERMEIIGDKTPVFYAQQAKHLHRLFPDAFYVQIVRDPRDVIVSHHFHAYRLKSWNFFDDRDKAQRVYERLFNGEKVGQDLLDEGALLRLLQKWIETQTCGIEAASFFPDTYYMLRYEDLLTDPLTHLKNIFTLTGLPLNNANCQRIRDKFSFETISGGRKPGQEDVSSFLRKGVAGDWRHYLSKTQSDHVTSAAEPLMARFGYSA